MDSVIGYVPGVFDMFHVGHLNILRRSRERCDWLIAGVVSDAAVEQMKGQRPVVPLEERVEIVRASTYVDEVVVDHSSDKRLARAGHPFDVLFKGSDWKDTDKGRRLEAQLAEVGVGVVYLPYTDHTSSTKLRDVLGRLAVGLSMPLTASMSLPL